MNIFQAIAGFLVVLLLTAGSAFAQSETDSYANERDPNWQGTVSGAGNLDKCRMTEDDKTIFLQAVRSNLDPYNFPSATISVMPVSQLEKLEEERARQAGFDPDALGSPETVSAAAAVESHIVTFDCREWSEGKEWDVIVVEYKKSQEKKTFDQKLFKLRVEQNVQQTGPEQPQPLQEQTPRYDTSGGTTRQGRTRPSQAEICQRNPQAYQCLYGVPSSSGQLTGGTQQTNRQPSYWNGTQQQSYWTGTQQTSGATRSNPKTQSANTLAACPENIDPLTWVQMHGTGLEMLDTLGAMGLMTDRYLNTMGEIILDRMAQLAKPNAQIWQTRKDALVQASNAVANYLTNDIATNHEMLRQAADKAVHDFMQHPEKVGAEMAVDMLAGKAGAMTGSVCKAGLGKLGNSVKASRFVLSAKTWIKLNKAKQEFSKHNWGAACSYHPNPHGLKNACIPSMWADYFHDESGYPFTASNFKWEPQDITTSEGRIEAVQKQLFGDRRFAHQSNFHALLQSEGVPAPMPNGLSDVVADLKASGEGAQGFVYVEYQSGRKHAFRSAFRNGRAVFKDSLENRAGGFNFQPTANPDTVPVRMYHYLVDGPDRVPGPAASPLD